MKLKWIVVLFAVIGILFGSNVYARNITLPNGSSLNIDNLTTEEIAQAIELSRKSTGDNGPVKETMVDVVKNVNPDDLNAWRELITGTIKDVCNDLNVTVNEFVKTPVGLGIAAMIVYKVAGKELLHSAMQIIVLTPLYLLITGFNLFIARKYLGQRFVYDITIDGKTKTKTNGRYIPRYNWAVKSEAKGLMVASLIVIQLIFTAICIPIIL